MSTDISTDEHRQPDMDMSMDIDIEICTGFV